MCLTMYSTLDRGEGALGSDSKYSRKYSRTAVATDTDTFTYCYAKNYIIVILDSQKNVFKAQRMKGEAITLLFQKTL